jgi:RNA polymerase subunit RPABC4/transcription elongation factor Spt4
MILCLSCRRISPAGGKFCMSCGIGLGSRFCENGGHPTPLGAEACPTCGTFDLSDGGRTMSLTPLARLVAMGVAVWAWKGWVLPHLSCIAAFAAGLALETAAFLTNTTTCHIRQALSSVLLLIGFLWLLGQAFAVLPQNGGALGKLLRDLPTALLRLAWQRVLPRAMSAIWAGLARLVVTDRRRDGETGKPARGKKG